MSNNEKYELAELRNMDYFVVLVSMVIIKALTRSPLNETRPTNVFTFP